MNVLDLFFPIRCVGCGRFGRYICGDCLGTITPIQPYEQICPVCERVALGGMTHPVCLSRYSLDGLTGFFRYRGVIRKAVKLLKYRWVRDISGELTGLVLPQVMAEAMKYMGVRGNGVLIPVPLHPRRERMRGFNQAAVLGRCLAGRYNLEVASDILRRVRYTAPQVTMPDRAARLANQSQAFGISPTARIDRNTVYILFDDVFTTGATLRAAASGLKHRGARRVWGMTLAR